MIHFRKKEKQDGARMRASPRVKEKEIEEVNVVGRDAGDGADSKLPRLCAADQRCLYWPTGGERCGCGQRSRPAAPERELRQRQSGAGCCERKRAGRVRASSCR